MSVVYHFVSVIYIYIISVQVSEKNDKKFNTYIYIYGNVINTFKLTESKKVNEKPNVFYSSYGNQ